MASINVRIDTEVKEKAEKVFSKLGITPTAAISLFYNQVIRTNSIPFELKADFPNEVTVKALNELEQMERCADEHRSFSNVSDLMEDLLK